MHPSLASDLQAAVSILDFVARGWSALGDGEIACARDFAESAWRLADIHDLEHAEVARLLAAIQRQEQKHEIS